jgi:hypothetical protein
MPHLDKFVHISILGRALYSVSITDFIVRAVGKLALSRGACYVVNLFPKYSSSKLVVYMDPSNIFWQAVGFVRTQAFLESYQLAN